MNQKIKISSGILSLTDKMYLASGGEGTLYVNGDQAYKLYHDPDKKMLPAKKMQELAAIGNNQIVIPREIIYDPATGKPLGYVTKFIDGVEPLVKLFTRTFKDANNVSYRMVNELVKQLQLVVTDVHKAKCLIVDLNELNILAGIEPTVIVPWFIDTDSYSTPSFHATAIMDSVRDRKASQYDSKGQLHYNPTIESDWFSWAILAFNLYSNIHPYRGIHPKYKPKDKHKQMDDGVSVFHPDVRTPPSVNDFKLIPARHLDWFKRVFLNGERGTPPLADSNVPMLVPTQIVTIKGTDKLDVVEISAYSDAITSVHQFMGVYYVATKKHVYANKREILTHNAKKLLLSNANNGNLVVASQNGNIISFAEPNNVTPIGTIKSEDMFARNGMIYTITNGKLMENAFTSFSNKLIHRITELENVSVTSSKMYEGCVIQDLLGKKFLTLPYKQGCSFSKHIPQLSGYRVIGAKCDKNIVVVIAEKSGQYDRFVIVFTKDYSDFDTRIVSDVSYNTINFCVMDSGLCLLLNENGDMEIFVDNKKVEIISNAPLDSSMPLFATADGVFFVLNNSIHQVKKK